VHPIMTDTSVLGTLSLRYSPKFIWRCCSQTYQLMRRVYVRRRCLRYWSVTRVILSILFFMSVAFIVWRSLLYLLKYIVATLIFSKPSYIIPPPPPSTPDSANTSVDDSLNFGRRGSKHDAPKWSGRPQKSTNKRRHEIHQKACV